jgi:hypothetical protein
MYNVVAYPFMLHLIVAGYSYSHQSVLLDQTQNPVPEPLESTAICYRHKRVKTFLLNSYSFIPICSDYRITFQCSIV